jgi:hypothetical protein
MNMKSGTIKKGEVKLERKKKWEYEKRVVSNGNQRYPTVASRFFRLLLLDTKVKLKELRDGGKEKDNQGRRREVREEENLKYEKQGRCQMVLKGTQGWLHVCFHFYY